MMRKTFLLLTLFVLIAGTAWAGPGEITKAQGQPIQDQYIVTFADGVPARATAEDMARTFDGRVLHVYEKAVNGAAFQMTERQAQALANHPNVLRVEEDGVVRAFGDQSNATWGIDRVDQRSLPLSGTYHYDYTGAGVTAYIIDTGIRVSHNDFGNRASIGTDTIGDGQNGDDCNGHGTHVAGTVGGTTWGVAKGVNLVAVRVLDCGGGGTYSGVIAGVDWVTQNANQPAVANMSLGGGANSTLDDAVNNSVASGVFYAVAAGNSSADACNYSPARAADAYTVGSTTSSDSRSSFSNYGTCLDIFGPGSSITSAWYTGDSATNTISGTSMAAPHVAGAAALVLEQYPSYSASQVGSELAARATANVVGSAGSGSPNLLLYTLDGSGGGCTITESPEVSCTDGIDNDCDGQTDSNDSDCGGGSCSSVGASCSSDSECCSNSCKGKPGAKTCK